MAPATVAAPPQGTPVEHASRDATASASRYARLRFAVVAVFLGVAFALGVAFLGVAFFATFAVFFFVPPVGVRVAAGRAGT